MVVFYARGNDFFCFLTIYSYESFHYYIRHRKFTKQATGITFFFVLHRPVAAWHFFFLHDASQRSQNNKGARGTSIRGEKKKWKEEAKLEVVWQPLTLSGGDYAIVIVVCIAHGVRRSMCEKDVLWTAISLKMNIKEKLRWGLDVMHVFFQSGNRLSSQRYSWICVEDAKIYFSRRYLIYTFAFQGFLGGMWKLRACVKARHESSAWISQQCQSFDLFIHESLLIDAPQLGPSVPPRHTGLLSQRMQIIKQMFRIL